MLEAKSTKKMLRRAFSVFESEQCLEMGNYCFVRGNSIEISLYLANNEIQRYRLSAGERREYQHILNEE